VAVVIYNKGYKNKRDGLVVCDTEHRDKMRCYLQQACFELQKCVVIYNTSTKQQKTNTKCDVASVVMKFYNTRQRNKMGCDLHQNVL